MSWRHLSRSLGVPYLYTGEAFLVKMPFDLEPLPLLFIEPRDIQVVLVDRLPWAASHI